MIPKHTLLLRIAIPALLLAAAVGCTAGRQSPTSTQGSQSYPSADQPSPEAVPLAPTQLPTATPTVFLPPSPVPTATPTVTLPSTQGPTVTAAAEQPTVEVYAEVAFEVTVLHTNDTSGYVDPCG